MEMNIENRIVIQIPLDEVWNDKEVISASRKRYVKKEEVSQILRHSPVRFAIARIGKSLIWIEEEKCYGFWKSEIEANVANPAENIEIDSFPNNFAYLASEWYEESQRPIILLEQYD